jgi:hypothetical protein
MVSVVASGATLTVEGDRTPFGVAATDEFGPALLVGG